MNGNRQTRVPPVAAAILVALLASTGMMVGSRAATTSPVLAWGSNADRQLGPKASDSSSATPVEVAGLGEVDTVAAGFGHSLALGTNGTVWAWGRNAENELGDKMSKYTLDNPPRADPPAPDRAEPGSVYQRVEEPKVPEPQGSGSDWFVKIGPYELLTGVTAVTAGWFHSLAVKGDDDGSVWAWGENFCGQLGNAKVHNVYGEDLSPPAAVQVPGLADVVAVAAGRGHSLALDDDGVLWAWGDNRWGQLGNGQSKTGSSTSITCEMPDGGPSGSPQILPTRVHLPGPVVAFAAGSDHSLALTSDGTVWSWGNNCSGQLGPGPGVTSTSSRPTPVPVSGLPAGQVVALAAGGTAGGGHSVALTASGGVWAWGRADVTGGGSGSVDSPCKSDPLFTRTSGSGGDVGGLVDQRARIDPSPVADPAGASGFLTDVVAIDAGMVHTLALTAGGKVFAWGGNDVGQLGPNASSGQTAPAAVKALDGSVAAVSAATHSLALPGPPPARPVFDFTTPGPDDLPADPGSVVPDDPTTLVPVDPDNLPVDPDDPPLDDDDPPLDDDDAPVDPDDPAGLARGGGPIGGAGGGVFVTGSLADMAGAQSPEDPNFNVNCTNWGCNPPAAQHFVRRAVAYVTPGDDVVRLLLVERRGSSRTLEALGFERCRDEAVPVAPGCFDRAYNDGVHHPARTPDPNNPDPQDDVDHRELDRDLRSVPFADYDAVFVGSRIYLADQDVLVARQQELHSYLNGGGGLLAFSNCPPGVLPNVCTRPADDAAHPPYQGASPGDLREIRNFDYLPFLDFDPEFSERFRYQSGSTVTDEGRALGLSEAHVVGTVAEGYFTEPCGFDPLVRSADGFIVTMATHKPVPTPCVGANVPDVRVDEGDGGITPATFSVSLGTTRDTPVRVDYTTIAAGATAGDVCPDPQAGGADYLTTKGTLTFPAGSTGPLTVAVPVCGDRLSESDETFLLRLTSPDDVGLEVTATGTIVDDEPRPPGDAPDTGTTPGGGDRGENVTQAPVQPTQPVQVPAPAPVAAPAPAPAAAPAAAAAAPAAALAPALAPAPAPAQATSQAQAQQGSQAQAQQDSQAEAQAGSPAQATAASPQVGMATDEQRQSQIEKAKIEGGPDELLASERRPDPTGPLALFGAAAALAIGLGGVRRRPAPERHAEQLSSSTPPPKDDRRLSLRRARGQR